MTQKQEIIEYMVSEYNNNEAMYHNNPVDLAMNAAEMFELWERIGDCDHYPDWLDNETDDICQGNY